jgi:DNA-binding NtrC family response regulator
VENTLTPKIIGESEPMKSVFEAIDQVSVVDVPVLITGESGTGKDLVAQTIHLQSKRGQGPFIPINMGSLSPELVESELFGHERGAFTGATKRKPGKFELAKTGTLFMDEITTMEPKVQVSLLRVLETGSFQRVGGNDYVSTDARIIAATNQDILESIRQKSFREDLFYRLNVFNIKLPPLRERGDDILILAEEFLRRYSREFSKDVTGFSSQAVKHLASYRWPGNVRELENAVIKAVIMSTGKKITPRYLPKKRKEKSGYIKSIRIELGSSLNDVERRLLKETITYFQGNKSEAAKALGISRKALYNKLHFYSLNEFIE